MNGSDPKQTARELLAEAHPALIGLSHWIHANPELGEQEVLASGWVAEWLATAGFEVETGLAGMPTALRGSFGPGPFHVAICAEYDALPAIGHACGHNVIAAAAVGAGVALSAVAEELGLRVTVLGTPAEEGGGGKLRMIEAGVFDGVHAALMVHPWPKDVLEPDLIAVQTLDITYTGREAHAAGYPERGVNAADALVIAQASIGLLRQHLLPTDRVHGIVTKGGDAPNVVPAHTSAQFMTRAATGERLVELTEKVRRCFEAGAIATGSELSIREGVAYAEMRHDSDLSELYRQNAEALGRVFDADASLPVSSDMGDVSHVVPAIHPMIGIDSGEAVNHQPEFTDATISPAADQAIFDGGLALAWTVIDAARSTEIRARLTGTDPETWVRVAEEMEPDGTVTYTEETVSIFHEEDGTALVEQETWTSTELPDGETLVAEHHEWDVIDASNDETAAAEEDTLSVVDEGGTETVIATHDSWSAVEESTGATVTAENEWVSEAEVAESGNEFESWTAHVPSWLMGSEMVEAQAAAESQPEAEAEPEPEAATAGWADAPAADWQAESADEPAATDADSPPVMEWYDPQPAVADAEPEAYAEATVADADPTGEPVEAQAEWSAESTPAAEWSAPDAALSTDWAPESAPTTEWSSPESAEWTAESTPAAEWSSPESTSSTEWFDIQPTADSASTPESDSDGGSPEAAVEWTAPESAPSSEWGSPESTPAAEWGSPESAPSSEWGSPESTPATDWGSAEWSEASTSEATAESEWSGPQPVVAGAEAEPTVAETDTASEPEWSEPYTNEAPRWYEAHPAVAAHGPESEPENEPEGEAATAEAFSEGGWSEPEPAEAQAESVTEPATAELDPDTTVEWAAPEPAPEADTSSNEWVAAPAEPVESTNGSASPDWWDEQPTAIASGEIEPADAHAEWDAAFAQALSDLEPPAAGWDPVPDTTSEWDSENSSNGNGNGAAAYDGTSWNGSHTESTEGASVE